MLYRKEDFMDDLTIRQAIKEFGTPAYIFDLDSFTARLNKIQNKLGKRAELCYAMKANPFLIKAAHRQIRRFEVCSPGEFAICEREGILRSEIILSGVNKEELDIEYIMDSGSVSVYTVESLNQLALLDRCSRARELPISVLMRVTSGNQFGLDPEDISAIIAKRDSYPYITFLGLQLYSGTQKRKIDKITKELSFLDDFCLQLKEQYGYEAAELEYGPGFYIPYFKSDPRIDENALLTEFCSSLDSLKFDGHITLEMGRFLAADCGYYATSIVDQKTNAGQHYCIIDGGIHHINYYGQAMAMKTPFYRFLSSHPAKERNSNEKEDIRWNICGSLCTVGDIIVKELSLPNAHIGDILVFEKMGAYSVTEGIYLFLSRRLPKILFLDGQRLILVRDGASTDSINSPQCTAQQ